ncbi:hypothetical protein [Rhodococcus koreensis]
MGETGWVLGLHADVLKYDEATVAAATLALGHTPTCTELEAFADPYGTEEADGNLVTTVGGLRLAALLTGSGQAFTNLRTVVGVGNSSAAEASGQTDLQAAAGATNRWFTGADAGFPSVAGNVITIKASFGPSDGNFLWNEWCYAISTANPVPSAVFATATTSGIMFNRKVQNLSTKPLGDTWIHSSTITTPA